MRHQPTTIESLHQSVEKAYASGITPPYDKTLFFSVLSLARIGFQQQERMVQLAAAMLNSLNEADRQVVLEECDIPGSVYRLLGETSVWPDPIVIYDAFVEMTPEQEKEYREQMERAINYHAEKEAARVITFGTRKQHSYREKVREAERLLATSNPAAEDPANWSYMNAEVVAGFETDIVAAANSLLATARIWRTLDAKLEEVTRSGIKKVRNDPVETLQQVVSSTNAQVTALVNNALGV